MRHNGLIPTLGFVFVHLKSFWKALSDRQGSVIFCSLRVAFLTKKCDTGVTEVFATPGKACGSPALRPKHSYEEFDCHKPEALTENGGSRLNALKNLKCHNNAEGLQTALIWHIQKCFGFKSSALGITSS